MLHRHRYSSNTVTAKSFDTAVPVKPRWQKPRFPSITLPCAKAFVWHRHTALQWYRWYVSTWASRAAGLLMEGEKGVYFCLPNDNNVQNFRSPGWLFQLLLPVWVSLVLQRQCHRDAEMHSSLQFISGLSQRRPSALSSSLIIYCILLADLIVFCPVLESCVDGFRKKSMCPDQQAFFLQRRGISKVPQFLVFICFL